MTAPPPAAPPKAPSADPDPDLTSIFSRKNEACQLWGAALENTWILSQRVQDDVVPPLSRKARIEAEFDLAVSAVVERWWLRQLTWRRGEMKACADRTVGEPLLLDMFRVFWDREQAVIDTKAATSLERVRACGPLTALLKSNAAQNIAPLAGVLTAVEAVVGPVEKISFWNPTVVALGLAKSPYKTRTW